MALNFPLSLVLYPLGLISLKNFKSSNVIINSCLDCGVNVQYGQPEAALVLATIEVFHI
jgi:hypothetical protein